MSLQSPTPAPLSAQTAPTVEVLDTRGSVVPRYCDYSVLRHSGGEELGTQIAAELPVPL